MKVLLIVYDNGSYISEFPVGLGYIAAVLRDNNHEVTIYSKDIYHYPEEHLTKYLDTHDFEFVGVSVVGGYWQYGELLRISKAVNNSIYRNNFIYVLGGHGPAPEPEFFLRKTNADVVVIGEGERTVLELCDRKPLSSIDGIAYIDNDNVFHKTKSRELIQDLDSIPFPAWEYFEMTHYVLNRFPNISHTDRSMTVLASRGCIFKCNFCVSGDTLINTIYNKRPIKEIRKNDYIYGYDCINKKIKKTKVIDISKRIDFLNRITLEKGKSIDITSEHPVLTKRGWINVSELTTNDEVLCYD